MMIGNILLKRKIRSRVQKGSNKRIRSKRDKNTVSGVATAGTEIPTIPSSLPPPGTFKKVTDKSHDINKLSLPLGETFKNNYSLRHAMSASRIDRANVKSFDTLPVDAIVMDAISKNMSENKEYANRIVTDYTFARDEFSKGGIKLDQDAHQQISTGVNLMKAGLNTVRPQDLAAVHVSISF